MFYGTDSELQVCRASTRQCLIPKGCGGTRAAVSIRKALMLYLKHIVLTRLGTESGAADDGKRASSVAWSCIPGRKALGEGGPGAGAKVGRARGFKSWVADLYP